MPAPRTTTFRTLASPSRVELLHLLQERGECRLADLVEATDLHPNTVREHLQRLIREGFVTSTTETRATRGRPRTLYAVADAEDGVTHPDVARRLTSAAERSRSLSRYRAQLAAVDSARAADAARAGDDAPTSASIEPHSAVAARQLEALDDHLDQSGFEAFVDERTLTVEITDCPYQSMVADSRGAVCQVHLGLIRTVLRQPGGPIHASELLPFHAPGCCTLRLEGRGEVSESD